MKFSYLHVLCFVLMYFDYLNVEYPGYTHIKVYKNDDLINATILKFDEVHCQRLLSQCTVYSSSKEENEKTDTYTKSSISTINKILKLIYVLGEQFEWTHDQNMIFVTIGVQQIKSSQKANLKEND